MARLPVIAAAVLAIAASAPVICTTTSSASAQGWRDRDGDTERDLRDFLRDRIRTRQDLRDLIVDLMQDRRDMRGRLRERIGERLAERRGGGEEEDCYFLTRSLRAQDGDLLVIVRRRVCIGVEKRYDFTKRSAQASIGGVPGRRP